MSSQQRSGASRKLRRRWLSFSLRSLFLLVTLCGVAMYGWNELTWQRKKRIAEAWVEALFQQLAKAAPVEHSDPLAADGSAPKRQDETLRFLGGEPVPCPDALGISEQLEILRVGIVGLPETRQRIAAVRLLVETFPDDAPAVLRHVIQRKTRAKVRALCLYVLSVYREKEDAEFAVALLKDHDAEVRAAAADCLGIIHCPAYKVPIDGGFSRFVAHPAITGDPPVPIRPLIRRRFFPHPDVIALPERMRGALEQMMVSGETVEERTAAARALVAWPPDSYKLRVAEWGVWIANGGELNLLQSVLDEIPPFVHRTLNNVESFKDRIQRLNGYGITKPIIHLTVDRPLAIDFDVQIARGRPWFAYPRPDDFTLETDTVHEELMRASDGSLVIVELPHRSINEFDREIGASLNPLTEGFPWLRVYRTPIPTIGYAGTRREEIVSLGLRWQSLIVSPQKLPWMAPPDVGQDPRFAWWSKLRQVPSSWVSSQGEAERFLYYDGPTLARSPLRVGFDGRVLSYCTQDMFGGQKEEDDAAVRPNKARTGLLVRVEESRVSAYRIPLDEAASHFVPETAQPIEGEAVDATFLKMLTDRGLTSDEARGLYESWKVQFFHTPGSRLLTFVSTSDYDAMCPLEIRPKPTEIVRVGIVLTELQ